MKLWNFELIKGTVRNESIKFASKLKRDTDENEKNLKNEVDELEKELSRKTENTDILEALKEKKTLLEEINAKRTDGIILRTKAEWIEGA